MSSRAAELSSLNSGLDDLTLRVARIAEDLMAANEEDVAVDLQNVQRALEEAGRKLVRILDRLR